MELKSGIALISELYLLSVYKVSIQELIEQLQGHLISSRLFFTIRDLIDVCGLPYNGDLIEFLG